jgi:hypothetical protein
MDKLAVYGQCPTCGGSLIVGHRCPIKTVNNDRITGEKKGKGDVYEEEAMNPKEKP